MNTLRDPFRELVRRPGVAAMSVLTVALASGAVLTLLALLDFLVLRPLPVRAPEQLAAVTGLDEGGRQTSLPFSMLSHLAESRDGVIGVAGYTGTGVVTVTIGTTMVTAGLDAVTDTYFSLLGLPATGGRLLQPGDGGHAPELVAVLGYEFWQRRFAGDPGVIGAVIHVENTPVTVIGITPEGFDGLRPGTPTDVTIPLTLLPRIYGMSTPVSEAPVGHALMRLRDPRDLTPLRGQLVSQWSSLLAIDGAPPSAVERERLNQRRPDVTPAFAGFSYLKERYSRPLMLLLGLAGALLLIASANLSGLLVVRTETDAHQQGVRLALGASRTQLVASVFAESLILAGVGTLAGALLALWGATAQRVCSAKRWRSRRRSRPRRSGARSGRYSALPPAPV